MDLRLHLVSKITTEDSLKLVSNDDTIDKMVFR